MTHSGLRVCDVTSPLLRMPDCVLTAAVAGLVEIDPSVARYSRKVVDADCPLRRWPVQSC